MINQMTIDGINAVITYDSDLDMFRGEFVGLNGGADFYAKDAEGLRQEGSLSLKVFMDVCREQGLEPYKAYSGKFVLRLPPDDHAAITRAAIAAGKSLNQWVAETLKQAAMQ